MQLVEWQEKIQHLILAENPMLKHSEGINNPLQNYLKKGAIAVETRLSIYTNAYVLRLIEALRSNYPAIHQLLGDDDFDSMAKSYLQIFPPVHTSIRWFGEHLTEFFLEKKPYQDLPVLAELANFEWAFRHTIDAADVEVVSVEYLQNLAPDEWAEATFIIHPSLSILELTWNAPQIWQALNEKKEPPEPVEVLANWLIYRQGNYISAWRSASDLEKIALNALSDGKSFADICEIVSEFSTNVSDVSSEVPPLVAGVFRAWVTHGLIALRTAPIILPEKL